MKLHPNWYGCGITAQAIHDILYARGEYGEIQLNDVLSQLNNKRLLTIEFRPYNYYEESHIFSCVKYNNRYCILDSYIKCKPFEIRFFDTKSFSKILSNVSEQIDETSWRNITNIPENTKISLSKLYKIIVISYPINVISLEKFMDKHRK